LPKISNFASKNFEFSEYISEEMFMGNVKKKILAPKFKFSENNLNFPNS
jgi:hypothetical protein